MTYYILKLVIMLPLMAAMIVGALWLYRKVQPGLATGAKQRDLRLVETLSMGASGKLAVVEFGDRRILLAATRGKIEQVAVRAMTDAERQAQLAAPDETTDEDGECAHDAPANPFQTILTRALAARAAFRQGRE